MTFQIWPTFVSSVPLWDIKLRLPLPPNFRHVSPLRATAIQPSQKGDTLSDSPVNIRTSTTHRVPSTNASVKSDVRQTGVPYFAYFAHMNPRKFGPLSTDPLRRFPIIRTERAILPRYKLTFTTPGVPPEPAFANLEPDNSSEVHGVIHWLSTNDFERLTRVEAVPPAILPQFAKPFLPQVINANAITDNGRSITISTVIYPSSAPFGTMPSHRYFHIGLDGAVHHHIDKSYIDNVLSKVPCANGPLGAFGLFTEPRPHLLDRTNPSNEIGDMKTEAYSPYYPIRARHAVEAFEKSEANAKSPALRLVQVTKDDISTTKRPLYFLPGIDGNGKSILSQVPELEKQGVYNTKAFVYPSNNFQSLKSLVTDIADMIYRDADGQPVSIVGESMGGALAIIVAIENARRQVSKDSPITLDIDLILAINPATSFQRSEFRTLWETLLSIGFNDDLYRLLLPPLLMPALIDFSSLMNSFEPESLARLRRMLFSLNHVAGILPQQAVAHRVKLLAQINPSNEELASLTGPHGPKNVAVIASVNDAILPSYSEVYRFRKHVKGIHYAIVPYGGHVLMFDKRFSLAGHLRPFYLERPSLASLTENRRAPSADVLKRRDAIRRRLKGGERNGLKLENVRERVRKIRDYITPVAPESAAVFIGEENLPLYDGKTPVLFVSNHTLIGFIDAMLPVARLLETRGILLRTTIHPSLSRVGLGVPGTGTTRISPEMLEEFGARKTSPRLLAEHLAMGRWCLLFPGGAREALKGPKDEKYAVIWPDKTEFIRSCALFGAVVVPMATVGTEDRVKILGSIDVSKRILRAIGKVTGNSVDLPRDDARQWRGEGTGKMSDEEIVIVPPVIVPRGRDRFYFRFGKPVVIDEECLNDREKEKEMYEKIQNEVRAGVDILKRRREADEFRDVEKRRNFGKQFGRDISPPAGSGWSWAVNDDAYLDAGLQPPL